MTVEIRALAPEECAAASEVSYLSLRQMAIDIHHDEWPEVRDPERARNADLRVSHIQRHDPLGSWVAVDGGEVVGVSLATKREGLWFLSLLAVRTDLQSQGIGKRLLDASLTYAEGCRAAWIISSLDPKAMRRYNRAGFELHPAYGAKGTVDHSLVEPDPKIRDGDFGRDAELVDELTRQLRGAAMGVDLDAYRAAGHRLLVLDDGSERGFSLLSSSEALTLGASSPAAGSRLLRASYGTCDNGADFEIGALTAGQQWGIETAHELRLGLKPGVSVCMRGRVGPLVPYIVNGAYG